MPIAAAPSLGLALLVAYSVTVHFAGEAIARAWPAAGWLLAVPPVAVNLALCWLFGRTLVRGRTPLIARFALMEQGNLAPDLAAYTRRLTWIWTALFAAAAATALALALSGNRDAWSWFTNLVNYLLVAGLFLGEYAYRRLRFRHYQHASLLQLLRNVGRAGLFER